MDVLGTLAYVYDDVLGYLGISPLFIQPLRVGYEEKYMGILSFFRA